MRDNPETIGLNPANTDKVRHVSWSDLPLSCPMPGSSLWNSHQRVYLGIQEGGRAQCPYCGTLYILDDPSGGSEHLAQPIVEMEQFYHDRKTEWLNKK